MGDLDLGYGPVDRGFTHAMVRGDRKTDFDSYANRDVRIYDPDPDPIEPDGVATPTSGHMTRIAACHAIEFMTGDDPAIDCLDLAPPTQMPPNTPCTVPEPFFANLWFSAPHRLHIIEGKPPGSEYDAMSVYQALVADADAQIGHIVDAVRRCGIQDRTLLFVSSDNGAPNLGAPPLAGSNAPYRGFKNNHLEGGLRSPLIAWWPSEIAPGATNASAATSYDFLPTLADILGVSLPAEGLLGQSLWPALSGGQTLYRFGPDFWEKRGGFALRLGVMKLIGAGRGRSLYNLLEDPYEADNLTGETEWRGMLERRYEEWRLEVGRIAPTVSDTTIQQDPVDQTRWVFGGNDHVIYEPDVRFNFDEENFTFEVAITPAATVQDQLIAERPGVWSLVLQMGGSVSATVWGPSCNADEENVGSPNYCTQPVVAVAETVVSNPLAAGEHDVAFSVLGINSSFLELRLFIDGIQVALGTGTVYRAYARTCSAGSQIGAVCTYDDECPDGASEKGLCDARLDTAVRLGKSLALSAQPFEGTLRNPLFFLRNFSELDLDVDLDGVPNARDNCILESNVGQKDADSDGIGDPCDTTPWPAPDQCDDGLDNDGDMLTDFADPGCKNSSVRIENPECDDGIDNDGDGDVDSADSGCDGVGWRNAEQPECSDNVDNDGDGFTDAADPGCVDGPHITREDPQCNDLIDNDFDGLIDDQDAQCATTSDDDESKEPVCGLLGLEAMLLAITVAGVRRRFSVG